MIEDAEAKTKSPSYHVTSKTVILSIYKVELHRCNFSFQRKISEKQATMFQCLRKSKGGKHPSGPPSRRPHPATPRLPIAAMFLVRLSISSAPTIITV